MNGNTNYTRSMFGLNDLNADTITTKNLVVTGPIKTNLIQSTASGQSLTVESQGLSKVIIKANGKEVMLIDNTNVLGFGPVIYYYARLYGYQENLTGGGANMAIGLNSIRDNGVTASFNIALGVDCLRRVQTSAANTAIGWSAGAFLTTGNGANMLCGYNSGKNMTTAESNMCIGAISSFGITTGSFNCSIGTQSGVQDTLYGTTSSNVSIGFASNNGLIGGVRNCAIGTNSNRNVNAAVYNDSTCIGTFSAITSSNQIQLGRASEYVSCQKMSIGKTSVPSNTLDIIGNQEINNGNLNFTRTTTSSQVIQWNDEFSNSLGILFASTLSSAFQFQFNPTYMTNGFKITSSGSDRFQVSDTSVTSINYITAPTEAAGSNNTRLATTAFVTSAISTAGAGYATLAGNNTFTGTFNTFNSSGGVSFGIQAPSCSFLPTLTNKLCNKDYVDNYALVPIKKLTTFTEDFISAAGAGGTPGIYGQTFTTTGTGTAAWAFGTNMAHPGVWTLTNNRSVYIAATIYSGFPKQIKWVARETTALNTFNWYAGMIQSIGVFTRSACIGHTSGTTDFICIINNVTVGTFAAVTWTQNTWYEMTIDFNDPDVSFTIYDLSTVSNQETITVTGSSYAFNQNNTFAFQHVSIAGTNTAEVDYCSLTYQAARN